MKSFHLSVMLGALLLCCAGADGQNISLGFRAGISIPNLTAGGSEQNPLNTGFSSGIGPDAAVFANFQMSPLFSVRPMIEYSSQGGKKRGLQAFPTPPEFAPFFPDGAPPYLYADFKNESKLNYLLVPVLFQFGWNLSELSPFRAYVNGGPFAGFLMSGKQITSGSSLVYLDANGQQPLSPQPQSFDKTNDIKDQLHTFNAGVEANAGFSYNAGRNSLFLEGGFNYGFINIQKGAANGKNHTGAGTVALGYAYRLK